MERPKQTRGRQKIEMKRIENEDDRLITFSKRKSGIYKKCSELTTLCGAEVGVIIFSPSGKPFSFAHPSIDSLANRFLNRNTQNNDSTHVIVEAHKRFMLDETKQQHNKISEKLDFEKERGTRVKTMKSERGGEKEWWDISLETLNLEALQQIHSFYQVIRNNLANHLNERSAFSASSSNSNLHARSSNIFATNLNLDIQPSTLPPKCFNEETDAYI